MSTFSPNVRKLIYKIRINYEPLGNGRHREVYLLPSKKFIVKIPINIDGALANIAEYKYWKNREVIKEHYNVDLARCRLYQGSAFQDKLLVMEFIKDKLDNEKYLPSWAFKIDCSQVGRNRQGKIVAYDYGSQEWDYGGQDW